LVSDSSYTVRTCTGVQNLGLIDAAFLEKRLENQFHSGTEGWIEAQSQG
jgi:hypothetical protein